LSDINSLAFYTNTLQKNIITLADDKNCAMSFSIITAFLLPSLFILTALLFSTSNYGGYTNSYAQFQNNMSSSSLPGVNITFPQKGQQIPVSLNDLTISGKSTDKPATDDCQVSVIVNNVKPYQPATANGTTGENNDYSRWFFILNSNYTSIKEGVNKITAKLSCIPTIMGDSNNMTKWYSINVTGITTRNDTTITPQSPRVINSSAQVGPNIKNEQRPLESKANEKEQEAPIFDSNNDDKKIGEEIENLRERIIEQVEEGLEKMGIELNLP
jgi:hypothetical protein